MGFVRNITLFYIDFTAPFAHPKAPDTRSARSQ